MKEYPNFYELLKEAQDRLMSTVVMYDGLPYQMFAITDHKKDGIFRAWLAPIGDAYLSDEVAPFVRTTNNYQPNDANLGVKLDELLEQYPNGPVLRKHLSSSKFNRFRPFPLGMCNLGTQCLYVERAPIRPMMQQGLVRMALNETLVSTSIVNPTRRAERVELFSQTFRDCILADHNSAKAVLAALLDKKIANNAHAFHREFALCRGPIGMIFLAYRTDIIGILSNLDFSLLKLGREFIHCREAVEELGLFERIC